jgi:hypothetical protein
LSSAVKPPKRFVSADIRSKGDWVSGVVIGGEPFGPGR